MSDHDAAMAAMDRGEFAEAAKLEERAVAAVPADQIRTRGILCTSAVSLWLSAGEIPRAQQLARQYLDEGLTPGFAAEMRALVARKVA